MNRLNLISTLWIESARAQRRRRARMRLALHRVAFPVLLALAIWAAARLVMWVVAL